MPGTILEPLDFAPTGAMLAAAIDELRELGTRGGGAVEGRVRERALRAFLHAQRERTPLPPGWRHDYSRLDFGGLTWSSGRARVPVLPRAPPRRMDDSADVPALAVDNAGGIVHAGSTYLATARNRRRSARALVGVGRCGGRPGRRRALAHRRAGNRSLHRARHGVPKLRRLRRGARRRGPGGRRCNSCGCLGRAHPPRYSRTRSFGSAPARARRRRAPHRQCGNVHRGHRRGGSRAGCAPRLRCVQQTDEGARILHASPRALRGGRERRLARRGPRRRAGAHGLRRAARERGQAPRRTRFSSRTDSRISTRSSTPITMPRERSRARPCAARRPIAPRTLLGRAALRTERHALRRDRCATTA